MSEIEILENTTYEHRLTDLVSTAQPMIPIETRLVISQMCVLLKQHPRHVIFQCFHLEKISRFTRCDLQLDGLSCIFAIVSSSNSKSRSISAFPPRHISSHALPPARPCAPCRADRPLRDRYVQKHTLNLRSCFFCCDLSSESCVSSDCPSFHQRKDERSIACRNRFHLTQCFLDIDPLLQASLRHELSREHQARTRSIARNFQ